MQDLQVTLGKLLSIREIQLRDVLEDDTVKTTPYDLQARRAELQRQVDCLRVVIGEATTFDRKYPPNRDVFDS